MVMERVSLPDAENLEQVAEDLWPEGDIAHDLPDVISMCRACLDSPSLKWALELGSWWREVTFVISQASSGEPPSVAADQRPRRPRLPRRCGACRRRLQDR
jgi:hypothetical protein